MIGQDYMVIIENERNGELRFFESKESAESHKPRVIDFETWYRYRLFHLTANGNYMLIKDEDRYNPEPPYNWIIAKHYSEGTYTHIQCVFASTKEIRELLVRLVKEERENELYDEWFSGTENVNEIDEIDEDDKMLHAEAVFVERRVDFTAIPESEIFGGKEGEDDDE